MHPFLYKIAEIFHEQYGDRLYTCTFVFPNRRAGIFFQKYLAEIAGKPLFSPTMLTIQELFETFSSYRPAEKIEMLVLLHDLYGRISGSNESFDDFLYWGEMLLNDFNDVDKYLVDARDLFRNVHDYRLLDDDMSHLSETQVDAVRRFWSHFMPVEGNKAKEKFQETWEVLHELYSSFREASRTRGQVYEGMMFREVAERAKAGELGDPEDRSYVFVGLNALTPSESALLLYLKNRGAADFYWDYESPFVHDEQNRASRWVKENLGRFPSRYPLKDSSGAREKTKIEAIGIPSGIGQAKQVAQLLSGLIASNKIPDPDEAIQTAVVLPDESLLMPVLYSIPEEFGKINVTMGYALSNSSVALLVELVARLQQNIREKEGEALFYHRHVKALLSHPLVVLSAPADAATLRQTIVAYNRSLVSLSDIPSHPLLKQIFTPIARWQEIGGYLKTILTSLYNSLTEEKRGGDKRDSEKPDSEKPGEERTEGSTRAIDLEREFIVQCYKTITRLEDSLRGGSAKMSVETYFRLFKQLTRGISVAFSGEPLSGLQVMGVLETRAIDFENLIILSVNEGVYPLRSAASSFIPYTLRQGFGLPTREHQDSTYAYHFYRMISRAKRVFLLYDTRSEEMQTGEISRYFYQLKYLYPDHFEIAERVATYDVAAPEILPVSVSKTPAVMRKLDAFKRGGESFFSASLINNYINCPLQFYFTAVEGLSLEDEVQESVEADVFGSIFHRVMEIIYNRYKGKTVTPDVLNEISKDEELLTEALEKAFARYYFKDETKQYPLEGQHYLVAEILRSYVKQTLKVDRQFTPFEYVDSEYRFSQPYHVIDSLEVNFKGSIDRVDRVKEMHRIIDYKTGSGSTEFKEIPQLFDASKNNRPCQILQLFVYGLFYLMENPGARISPAVYYLRAVYKNFDPTIQYDKHSIDDISVYLPEFKEHFDALLEEIFNPAVPFTQTKNPKNCQWCAFRELCQR
ncbi:MAG: PD-(D/E)XK nuclease family protein [Proteiniphilum sp.]